MPALSVVDGGAPPVPPPTGSRPRATLRHLPAARGARRTSHVAPIQALTGPDGVRAALADRERLAEIVALDLLTPETDRVLDDAARRAAEWLGLPTAYVSVVLDEAQHFAALHGVDGWLAAARAMPTEWAFCRYAVSSGAAVVVEDTARDPRTRDNPLVYLEGIRCYAGIPLVTTRGHVVGTLCVTGLEPRRFSDGDLAVLRAQARDVMTRLEARRAAPRGWTAGTRR